MNDRFKFRFFNEYSNKLEFCDEYDLKDIFESGNPVMQCTGLKDKNGKLIYEGDVVKDDHDALHYVRWVYDSWQLFPCAQNNYTIGIVDDEIEVIGNIYENKSLLESEG